MLRHGFQDLELNRIYAGVFSGYVALEQVLRKTGMKHEGTLRQHYVKCGDFLDDECYGTLGSEWRVLAKSG